MYTTPKKIKHKRKKTKLAVLKYYKVDGDGKIERLRRECPTPEVGNCCRQFVAERLTMYYSAELVSSWLLCTIASTVVDAISPTSLTVRWRNLGTCSLGLLHRLPGIIRRQKMVGTIDAPDTHTIFMREILSFKVICHDCPFGGKLEVCFVPSCAIRTYFKVLKDVQCPFQSRNNPKLCSSSTSGIQNPDLYSRSSNTTRCFSRSSLVLEARPGLRSALNLASFSSSRLINLVDLEPQESRHTTITELTSV